jgi:hypothetical protein
MVTTKVVGLWLGLVFYAPEIKGLVHESCAEDVVGIVDIAPQAAREFSSKKQYNHLFINLLQRAGEVRHVFCA